MTLAAFDLFTIGHSNHSLERFLELTRGAGITAMPWISISMPGRAKFDTVISALAG